MRKAIIILLLVCVPAAVNASQAPQYHQSEQRAWLTQPSDAFDRANLEDYRVLNGLMITLLSEAKVDHCTAYLIPKPEGPTLLMLSNAPDPITRPVMEKVFACLESKLEIRIKARTNPNEARK